MSGAGKLPLGPGMVPCGLGRIGEKFLDYSLDYWEEKEEDRNLGFNWGNFSKVGWFNPALNGTGWPPGGPGG